MAVVKVLQCLKSNHLNFNGTRWLLFLIFLFACPYGVYASVLEKDRTKEVISSVKLQIINIHDHRYTVEVPQSPKEFNQGLMYRKTMELDQGMIFYFHSATSVSMWTKNTFIPLDILFIGIDNKVACIIENARPLSTKHLSCPAAVNAVVELHAGVVKAHHINLGDKLSVSEVTPR